MKGVGFSLFLAFVESHVALVLFLVGFPTQHWLDGTRYSTRGTQTTFNIGLFKTSYGGSSWDTKELIMAIWPDGAAEYRKIHNTIILESIALPILVISVLLLYVVVWKRNIVAFWFSIFSLLGGGILAIVASVYPVQYISNPQQTTYSIDTSFGYSSILGVVSGSLAIATAVTLVIGFYRGEMKLDSTGKENEPLIGNGNASA